MKKLSKEEKRIMKDDIEGLKHLVDLYTKEGKIAKAAACEKEMKEIKAKLKGANKNGIQEI